MKMMNEETADRLHRLHLYTCRKKGKNKIKKRRRKLGSNSLGSLKEGLDRAEHNFFFIFGSLCSVAQPVVG
jgi:hypothetical protein